MDWRSIKQIISVNATIEKLWLSSLLLLMLSVSSGIKNLKTPEIL